MGEGIGNRLMHAVNVFVRGENPDRLQSFSGSGMSYNARPYATTPSVTNGKSIISSIYTRIGIDVAAVRMEHVKLDPETGRYEQTMKSGLNQCLTVEANLDQGARAFRQDMAMSLFDKGVIAVVPVDTSADPDSTNSYDIETMRVGYITRWLPKDVIVSLYNEEVGIRQEIRLPKKLVAVIENPLFEVMNQPNSTLQRLIHKLSLLDSADELAGSGKLDLIIQLPYVIKSEARRQQADARRKDIESQLRGSQYGIAYTDGTERITQLNRPAENNLVKQVESLTAMLYSQLGLTEGVFNGTASEAEMLNYHNRTVEPVLSAITEGMKRKFLTKTARTQGQSIEAFRDPFKTVTISSMADIADKFTRNEIATSNEIRSVVGWKPAADAEADKLRNKNIPAESQPDPAPNAT